MMSPSIDQPPEARGKYFEEFELGEVVISPGRTITETDVVQFAALSGDYNELHTNVEFAKATPFGQRIAHGLLGLSAASGLVARLGIIDGTVIAFAGLEWKFQGPVFIGDTIHITAQVERKRPMRAIGGGMVILAIAVINQRGESVQKGTWKALVRSKPTEG